MSQIGGRSSLSPFKARIRSLSALFMSISVPRGYGLSPNIDSYLRRMVVADGSPSHGDYRFSSAKRASLGTSRDLLRWKTMGKGRAARPVESLKRVNPVHRRLIHRIQPFRAGG